MMKATKPFIYDCIIMGAGISGLFAAEALRSHGLNVVLLEKSRGPGGRMATRRMGKATIDHGAQFFTTRQKCFEAKISEMIQANTVQAWHKNDYRAIRFRGTSGMNMIGKFLGTSLDVRKQHKVVNLSWEEEKWNIECDNGHCFLSKTLVSTAPVPQSLALIKASNVQLTPKQFKELKAIEYKPTLALLAVLKKASAMPPPGIIKLKDHPILETITDNQVKGISAVAALTIHSSHELAQAKLESLNDATAQILIQAAQEHVQFQVQEWALHGWRYAQCTKRHPNNYLQLKDYPLWLAGDGFGNARLEQAALSGLEAAEAILSSKRT